METNFKVYDIILNGEDETQGLDFISLDEKPAVQYDFLKFSEEGKKVMMSVENDEEQIALGVIMLADVPIYRNNDLLGEHYVVFSKETIKQIMLKFFKEGKLGSINLNHNKPLINGAYLFQSYIVDRKLGMAAPEAFSDVPDGSWIGAFKVEDGVLWSAIKAGLFNGFSIEGFFEYGSEVIKDEEKTLWEAIHSLLSQIK